MPRSDEQLKKQFERFFASSYDFGQANFCACYLLKKKWHSMPWERRGTIYEQQTAFVTNLIVAYARPFNESKGWPGFPTRLLNFDITQQDMHRKLLQMRNQIFAHSDSEHFSFRPFKAEGFRSTIEGRPFAVLSAVEVECIKGMTNDLIKATQKRLEEMHDALAEDVI